MSEYTPTIGLEVHMELETETKMFCGCPNDLDESHPNVNVCPICLGHPGTLPVMNKDAVEKVLILGKALSADLADESHFDRKSYFYPDLPKSFQISQYEEPLVRSGKLKGVTIRRVHLEEDTGSLIHKEDEGYSLVNYNRAGVPLAELVTEPDVKDANQAVEFAKELQLILRYLGISSADMEKGHMRIEANVSLNKGTKVEVKNINSFSAVEMAIDHEIKRQKKVLEDGGEVVQETRGWDDDNHKTVSQRSKESAHDYRYFPEPDLPPLNIKEEWSEEDLVEKLPELPKDKRKRFKEEYELPGYDLEILVLNKPYADYFEEAVSELQAVDSSFGYQKLFNYFIGDLRGLIKDRSSSITDIKISPKDFANLVAMIEKGDISSRIAKDMLKEMFETGDDPESIKEEGNFDLISDEGELESIVQDILDENEDAVSDYRSGKESAIKYLVGQVMAKTKGQADPQIAKEKLKELIEE